MAWCRWPLHVTSMNRTRRLFADGENIIDADYPPVLRPPWYGNWHGL
ncbi:hypothetical protein KCP74_11200 [Salmonella enterica subsp. enterica]|nr:hypothetical protein KCP74_11200 [Salmonella enterica subsp. enterica]